MIKRLTLAALLLLVTSTLFAQSATLAAPQTPPARTTIVVGSILEQRADPSNPNSDASATVELWLLAADGSKQDVWQVRLVGAEVAALINAEMTPITGETGTNARKKNARVLKFLKTSCATFATPCLSDVPNVTVVP